MTLTDINLTDMRFLKVTDFENSLNIYQDKDKNYFYNLNSSLYINVTDELLLTYTCDYDMQWPLLSYKIYGTTRLTWLLQKLNKVKSKDIFKMLNVGDKIKYISKEQMNNIIAGINNI